MDVEPSVLHPVRSQQRFCFTSCLSGTDFTERVSCASRVVVTINQILVHWSTAGLVLPITPVTSGTPLGHWSDPDT